MGDSNPDTDRESHDENTGPCSGCGGECGCLEDRKLHEE